MRIPQTALSSSSHHATTNVERPITVTVAKAQTISGLGATTIWARIGDGTLATVQVGRRRLILFDSLVKLLTPTTDAVSITAPTRRGRPRKAGKVGTP